MNLLCPFCGSPLMVNRYEDSDLDIECSLCVAAWDGKTGVLYSRPPQPEDEDADLSEADALEARPHLLAALDEFDTQVRMGLRRPEHDPVVAHLRQIERIIGRKP